MTDPIRAALDCLEEYDDANPYHDCRDILAAARRAIASSDRPTPVAERDVREWINSQPLWHGATRDELISVVIQALDRWGRPSAPPTPAAGEVGELAKWLYRLADERTCNRRRGIRPHPSALTRAATLLEQFSAVAPEVSDAELIRTYSHAVAAWVDAKHGPFDLEDLQAAQLAGLRAVLARWGTANSAQVSSSLAVVQAIREEVQNLDGSGGTCKHDSVMSILDRYLNQ